MSEDYVSASFGDCGEPLVIDRDKPPKDEGAISCNAPLRCGSSQAAARPENLQRSKI